MSVNIAKSPYHVFTDTDGTPLNDGYIYIGTAGTNPVTNPLSIYWDSSFTTPAANPVRTINGYASRNGSPASIYVEGQYSIMVKNKNGELVFSSLVADGLLVSINSYSTVGDLIGYTTASNGTSVNVLGYNTANDGGGDLFNWDDTVDKSTANGGTIIDPSVSLALQGTGTGLGCWIRQDKKIIHAVDFGAVGDATTDDLAALQACIDYAMDLSINAFVEINLDGLQYLLSDTLSIHGRVGVNYKGFMTFGNGGFIADATFSSGTTGASSPKPMIIVNDRAYHAFLHDLYVDCNRAASGILIQNGNVGTSYGTYHIYGDNIVIEHYYNPNYTLEATLDSSYGTTYLKVVVDAETADYTLGETITFSTSGTGTLFMRTGAILYVTTAITSLTPGETATGGTSGIVTNVVSDYGQIGLIPDSSTNVYRPYGVRIGDYDTSSTTMQSSQVELTNVQCKQWQDGDAEISDETYYTGIGIWLACADAKLRGCTASHSRIPLSIYGWNNMIGTGTHVFPHGWQLSGSAREWYAVQLIEAGNTLTGNYFDSGMVVDEVFGSTVTGNEMYMLPNANACHAPIAIAPQSAGAGTRHGMYADNQINQNYIDAFAVYNTTSKYISATMPKIFDIAFTSDLIFQTKSIARLDGGSTVHDYVSTNADCMVQYRNSDTGTTNKIRAGIKNNEYTVEINGTEAFMSGNNYYKTPSEHRYTIPTAEGDEMGYESTPNVATSPQPSKTYAVSVGWGSASATATYIKMGKNSSTSRSINAAGTINASGADYAEYMEKDEACGKIEKGQVCGVNNSAKLIDKFSLSHSFVVKSTSPSFVGGDRLIPKDGDTSNLDRIAFTGLVPLVISGSFNVGDFVCVEQGDNDSIVSVAKSEKDGTCVGKIWGIDDDGKPIMKVM